MENSKYEAWNTPQPRPESKRVLAGVLAILFGPLGVHKFVLDYQREGFFLLGLTILGLATACIMIGILFLAVAGLVSFVEGIIYLTKTDEEFYETYQRNKKAWF
jgi:TM2 domain-containing membrane protein YozV